MRHLFRHTVAVSRRSTALVNQTPTGATGTVLAAVRCWIEPMSSKLRDTEIGRASQSDYQITWGLEDIRVGDILTVTAPANWAGRRFIVQTMNDDTGRLYGGYRNGMLREAKTP